MKKINNNFLIKKDYFSGSKPFTFEDCEKFVNSFTKEEKLQLLTGARHNANHEILEAYLRAEYILKANKEERE